MNEKLFEQLLNEPESAYLDFKRDQYPFVKADKVARSELLKDILAFANAWRRTNAHILIGVVEVEGGRCRVVGVEHHLDDHSIQQFVNSKTQRPVDFSYIPFSFEGKQVGIIKIPLQMRPIYIERDFGKLKKRVVYIRRSSSTGEASPDEISRMGISAQDELNKLSLDLQFADLAKHERLSTEVSLASTLVEIQDSKIPDFVPRLRGFSIDIASGQPNKNYFKQLVQCYSDRSLVSPIGFYVKNLGQVTAYNVRVVITIEDPGVRLFSHANYPTIPPKYHNVLSVLDDIQPGVFHTAAGIDIEAYGSISIVTVSFGNIQPKADSWSEEAIFIGSKTEGNLDPDVRIFADNLPEPIKTPLSIRISVNTEKKTVEDLDKEIELEIEQEINCLMDPND